MKNWQGKKVLVIGAARQGLAATRFLASQGAQVILTDNRSKDNFPLIVDEFRTMPVRFVFGDQTTDLLDGVDQVFISGGVPLELPLIQQAKNLEISLTNDAQLFLDLSPAKIIGITGSAGKTTTTTLVGAIAKSNSSELHKVWVGGNIGNPLISDIEKISPDDWVVMELSSFQLDLMHASPAIAVVLNITPNHLDRHKTMQAYNAAKANILKFQKPSDWAVLNREDSGSFDLQSVVKGYTSTFGINKPQNGWIGTYVEHDFIMLYDGEASIPLISTSSIQLLGKHNLMNTLAACAVSVAAGFSTESMETGIRSTSGIPHRLELVLERDGVHWYNDSIATTPERVIAALNTIPGSLVLLLGGRDKDLPWTDLAALLNQRKPKVILFGEAGRMIHKILLEFEGNSPNYTITVVDDLQQGVMTAAKIAEPHDSVLLSPGGTSYDAFVDFEERGNLFRRLVEEIQ